MDKTYQISIEGQIIPIPPEIGADDNKVKAALAPFFPDAANALITRGEKDGLVTINVIKKAGTKGGPVDTLIGCAGGMNPVIELYDQISSAATLGPEGLLTLDSQIEAAIREGEAQDKAVEFAFSRLCSAKPIPSPVEIVGF